MGKKKKPNPTFNFKLLTKPCNNLKFITANLERLPDTKNRVFPCWSLCGKNDLTRQFPFLIKHCSIWPLARKRAKISQKSPRESPRKQAKSSKRVSRKGNNGESLFYHTVQGILSERRYIILSKKSPALWTAPYVYMVYVNMWKCTGF